MVAIVGIGAVVLIGAVVGGWWLLGALTGGEDEAGQVAAPDDDAVLLEPFGAPGPDPFTSSVDLQEDDPAVAQLAAQGAPVPELDPEQAALRAEPGDALEQVDGRLEIDGAAPGLYGGTRDDTTCDAGQLAAFLAADPDLAAAWASVPGIDPADIPSYLDSLTEARLAADTRVRNHGFRDGRATAREVVLQRGTAVLVDDRGVPRVRCSCGNPLAEPTIRPDEAATGEAWAAFDLRAVVTIRASVDRITELELTDLTTGQRFERPTDGSADRDAPSTVVAIDPPDRGPSGTACGEVTRASDGTAFPVEVVQGEVSCARAVLIAQQALDQGIDTERMIRDHQCLPPSAEERGRVAICESADGAFQIGPPAGDTDPPATAAPEPEPAPEAEPEPEPVAPEPETPSSTEVSCGRTEPRTVDNVSFPPFEVVVLPGNPITCFEAVDIGEEVLEGLADWALTDGVPVSGTVLYATEIRGWFCRVPSALLEGGAAPITCESPGGEFELRAP